MTPEQLDQLTLDLSRDLRADERLLLNYSGETSDFVRLNHNRIRQAGQVTQRYLSLELVLGQRHLSASTTLSGDAASDLATARALLHQLRERVALVPEDPWLNLPEHPSQSERRGENHLPPPELALRQLMRLAEGLDLVGIWASGAIEHGMADSAGSRHWHASYSFNLDWSCYLSGDRAVKNNYAGFAWDEATLARKLTGDRETLAVLERPPISLGPGMYRAYLTPAALAELLDMLAWGDLGLKSQRTRQSALLQLVEGERSFDPQVTLTENHARGLAPQFSDEGFHISEPVPLIVAGRHAGALVNPRSAKEYGVPVNSPGESPAALELAAGNLAGADILTALDTGLLITNLWYCNYSDRNHARITGMTRFATQWVENGRVVGPINVMRFDDTLYHLLGDRLEALTAERELALDPGTYGGRSSSSTLLPGALVRGIALTL